MALQHLVEIVTVGDELLLGETLDTNAAFVARVCVQAGFAVRRETTLPDDLEPLRQGLAEARERGGSVIVTGGLGPTPDDLTRWALAAVFGRGLAVDPALLAELEGKFRRFGYATMPAANRVQAELPQGATALPNPRGTAPGILIEDERATMFALPGVPSEMEGMLLEQVLPRMRERAGGDLAPLHQRVVRTAGIGESALAERIADLVRRPHGLRVAYLPGRGSVDVRLTAVDLAEPEARRALDELEGRLAERLAPWVYGRDEETLAGAVGRALSASGRTLAVAESCTGGLIGDLLTDVAGSSAYFAGGVVAYSNDLKHGLLDVSEETLLRHGAVSPEACAEMLAGARRLTGADCALAVTGIAGPGGGTPAKPVGLVHVGVDVDGAVRLERREWPGTRREVKLRAAKAVLLLLLRTLEAVPRPT